MVAERNYLALFVAESTDQLEQLGSELVLLEAAREAVPAELWDSIFRRVHSIKGGAATLGLTRLVAVAHAAEELIARQRSQPLGHAVVDLLLEAAAPGARDGGGERACGRAIERSAGGVRRGCRRRGSRRAAGKDVGGLACEGADLCGTGSR